MFENKKVLVTGGGGMIGRSLVKMLHDRGADITIADLTGVAVQDVQIATAVFESYLEKIK